jgi:hypothetical protein
LAIVIAVSAAVFFFGGFYIVVAIQPGFGIIAWALEPATPRSIATRSTSHPSLCKIHD